jgi:hypothetical protein
MKNIELTACEFSYIDESIPVILDSEGYFFIDDNIERLLNVKLRKLKKKIPNVHLDSGSFEVNTPVFYYNETLVEYYDHITKLMKKQGLVTHSKKTDGGGLHFHINLPSNIYVSQQVTMCYTLNRLPYLNWIFNNPIDTWNGNNPYLNFKDYYKLDITPDIVDSIGLFMLKGSKSTPMRFEECGTNRVEYRFFDMPYNRDEFSNLLNFVHALHENLSKTWLVGILESNDLFNCRELSMNFMIQKFKDLLCELGLDYKNYDIFVQRNMKTRYKYGKSYLV